MRGETKGVGCWGEEGALWQRAQMYKSCCNRSSCPRRRAEEQMIKHKSQPECLSSSVWWRPTKVASSKLKFGMERKSAFYLCGVSGGQQPVVAHWMKLRPTSVGFFLFCSSAVMGSSQAKTVMSELLPATTCRSFTCSICSNLRQLFT